MKKFTGILLAAVLSLMLPLTVAAAALTGCTVTADSVAGTPGGTVTVAISIQDNPGFTNFSMSLDYDREHLTLKSIETHDGSSPYLCGSAVSVNEAWTGEEGWGYIVSASPDAVKGDGILFTATFEIAADFTGEAHVTPVVRYIRNNEAVFSVFEELRAEITSGGVISALTGDVNGDGIIEYNDVMLAYKAFLGETALTSEQLAIVDANGNGTVDAEEYQAIYQIYIGGTT